MLWRRRGRSLLLLRLEAAAAFAPSRREPASSCPLHRRRRTPRRAAPLRLQERVRFRSKGPSVRVALDTSLHLLVLETHYIELRAGRAKRLHRSARARPRAGGKNVVSLRQRKTPIHRAPLRADEGIRTLDLALRGTRTTLRTRVRQPSLTLRGSPCSKASIQRVANEGWLARPREALGHVERVLEDLVGNAHIRRFGRLEPTECQFWTPH
jgi:hypothetical protein